MPKPKYTLILCVAGVATILVRPVIDEVDIYLRIFAPKPTLTLISLALTFTALLIALVMRFSNRERSQMADRHRISIGVFGATVPWTKQPQFCVEYFDEQAMRDEFRLDAVISCFGFAFGVTAIASALFFGHAYLWGLIGFLPATLAITYALREGVIELAGLGWSLMVGLMEIICIIGVTG